jgi:Sec-independent protein secretion pathway component TatC
MTFQEFEQFLISAAVLMIAGFVASAALTPPDPFTQAAVVAVLLPVVVVGSYVLAYRRGFEWT